MHSAEYGASSNRIGWNGLATLEYIWPPSRTFLVDNMTHIQILKKDFPKPFEEAQ